MSYTSTSDKKTERNTKYNENWMKINEFYDTLNTSKM